MPPKNGSRLPIARVPKDCKKKSPEPATIPEERPIRGAMKGDTRAAELLLDRGYGKPKQTIARIPTTHEMNWVDSIKGTQKISCPFDYAARLVEGRLGRDDMDIPRGHGGDDRCDLPDPRQQRGCPERGECVAALDERQVVRGSRHVQQGYRRG